MGLESIASLIVASSELSVVRLLRDAIRTADISSGRGMPASPLGPAPTPDIAPRRHIEPEPVYEPRRHIRPAPRFEERPVFRTVYYETRVEPAPAAAPSAECACAVAPKPAIEGLIPPVWKQLPPVAVDPPPRRPVKVLRHQPDIRHKGIVVDLHV
ncbi:MAG TPA: hypothetical protein VF796_18445 [Humisphaera sp.]